MYYIYMLRCADSSIYTGITTDLERRMREHFSKNDKCAKYTLRHSAIRLETAFVTDDRKNASKLEYHIKYISKKDKESLILDNTLLENILGDKVDAKNYSIYMGL